MHRKKNGKNFLVLTEILEKGEDGTSDRSPDPMTSDEIIRKDLVRNGSYQHDAIGHSQANQIAVSGRVH